MMRRLLSRSLVALERSLKAKFKAILRLFYDFFNRVGFFLVSSHGCGTMAPECMSEHRIEHGSECNFYRPRGAADAHRFASGVSLTMPIARIAWPR